MRRALLSTESDKNRISISKLPPNISKKKMSNFKFHEKNIKRQFLFFLCQFPFWYPHIAMLARLKLIKTEDKKKSKIIIISSPHARTQTHEIWICKWRLCLPTRVIKRLLPRCVFYWFISFNLYSYIFISDPMTLTGLSRKLNENVPGQPPLSIKAPRWRAEPSKRCGSNAGQGKKRNHLSPYLFFILSVFLLK